ncbi:MAG: alkane 1-monooxygenase [Proteobacteria bacterium]|nr:alkane 1-monooxygenase [Pseudomonadota bacterium]
MRKLLPFTMIGLTSATLLGGLWIGGWGTFLTPLVVFFGIPVADLFVGIDTEETAPEGSHPLAFNALVRSWVVVETLTLAAVLWFVSTHGLTGVEWAGVLLSTALMTGGGGINVAHELMHRTDKRDRAMAEWLMTMTSYTHFCVEHVLGHHRNVATFEDPATSRRGETVYAFIPRVIAGTIRSAWALEGERTKRRGIPWWSLRNRRLRYALDLVAVAVAIGLVFGPLALAFFWAQGVLAFTLLEVINYVEHYGLLRAKLANGKYERVRPEHSWNANFQVSNGWLFNLQRHADHHANASRPYYHLRALQEGPQLPFGYPIAILLALVPPAWMAVMHPLIDGHRTRRADSVA